RVRAKGSRRLVDPGSAIQFVLLVPGVAAGVGTLVRALLALALRPAGAPELFGQLLLIFWLDHALGLLVVAPPLLVVVTPWLIRWGVIVPQNQPDRVGPSSSSATAGGALAPYEGGTSTRWGDWLEIGGLAFGASLLCLMLSGLHGRRDLLGWQLWGVQILV